jgi:hypothetical protein
MMEVHEGLARLMKALTPIAKEHSTGVSYKFRSIDAVFNSLHRLLADEGLWLRPVVLDDWQVNLIPGTNNRQQAQALFRVEVFACASDGSTHSLGVGLAQSHDYGDKAAYQAQQNAVKYVLIEAFAIPTDEQDLDGVEADPVPVEPTPGEWLSVKVDGLGLWTPEERRQAYSDGMHALDFQRLSSLERAKDLFDWMLNAYQADHPDTGSYE